MRVSGVAAALVAACLASGAWAGEDKSWSGESGAPAPLTGRYVLTVQSQRVQITVLEPLPRHMVEAVIRVEYVLKNEGQETQRVAVGFPVCHQEAPTGEREWWGPWPEAYVKLDGRPVEARLAMFMERRDPKVVREKAGTERAGGGGSAGGGATFKGLVGEGRGVTAGGVAAGECARGGTEGVPRGVGGRGPAGGETGFALGPSRSGGPECAAMAGAEPRER
jgi:hypothetical protein